MGNIKSCADILESNRTVMSIFQIKMNTSNESEHKHVVIDSSQFPNSLCPLIFKNANIRTIFVFGLVDSFYKRNVLKFTDDVDFQDLNSTIVYLNLENVENINLDSKLLNRFVFSQLYEIHTRGAINQIDKSIFTSFLKLKYILFEPAYFRKFIHKNGIDWIKETETLDLISAMKKL